MLKPRALAVGDRIAVVAPASPFAREEFDAGVSELRALGFDPVYDERVFAREGFVAGDAALRARAFREAWRDPGITAIVGVRGGYGSVQILPLLDAAELRAAPKAVIGYSDLTSLLVYLTCVCGIVSFHGPMLAGRLGRGADGYDRESFMRCLQRPEAPGEFAPAGLEVLHSGEASGVLLGGTLTQLVASLGTPYAFAPPDGHVLFLDEVGERPYKLDRMLTQLRLSGVLARAGGIVFGELPRCDEPAGTPTARDVAASALHDFRGPVLVGFPSGHTTGPAWTLPFGVRARVAAERTRPALVIEEAAVTAA